MARCVLIAVALLALAPPAFGDGGPVVGMDAGPSGVTVRGVPDRYVAMQSLRGTTIARVERDGGRVVVSRFFPRGLTIPIVAHDGTATGLSADGSTLVAARLLRRRSEFTVLETERLKRRATITLSGRFTLDAVSRDGGLLYLIQTLPDERYAVRAYDAGARELLPEPVVDPHEPDEPMAGLPLTRAASRDGRWAYTLYDGDHPFIHALDTQEATAKCIDLDALAGRDDLLAIKLRVGPGGTIAVKHVQRREPLLVVDPRTFAVRKPRPAPRRESRSGWPLIVAGLAVPGLVATGARRRRRRRTSTAAG